MATKLYSRQGGNIQGKEILRPIGPDMTKAKILGDVSATFKTMADQNYELGKAQLINSVIDNAYQTAPADLAKFDELIKSNLEKSTESIPNKWREEILLGIKPKVDAMRAKVIDNALEKADNERINNALEYSNQSLADYTDATNAQFQALENGDKEALRIAMEYEAKTRKNLQTLAGLTDRKGNYIIGNKSMRDAMASGNYGKVDVAKQRINNMSLEQLTNFDNTTFQDRAGFKKAYGITDKEYDDIEKYIASRRKALGDEEKRIIKAQTEFNLARMAQAETYNEQELDDLDIPNDIKKAYKKAHKKYEGAVNPALANDGFLASMAQLEGIINDTDITDPDHNMKLLASAADVLANINAFAGMTGLDTDKTNQLQRSLYESIVSQEFADAMKPLYADNRVYALMQQTLSNLGNKGAKSNIENDPFLNQTDAEITKAMKNTAVKIIQQATALAATGNYDAAQEVINNGNKQLIHINYSKILSPWEFANLERKLKNNEPALFTRNGKTWEFLGYDNKDALFKTKM